MSRRISLIGFCAALVLWNPLPVLAAGCDYDSYKNSIIKLSTEFDSAQPNTQNIRNGADELLKIGECTAKASSQKNPQCQKYLEIFVDEMSKVKMIDLNKGKAGLFNMEAFKKQGIDIYSQKYSVCMEYTDLISAPANMIFLSRKYDKDKNREHLAELKQVGIRVLAILAEAQEKPKSL
ncbi:hypothetical protein WDW89_10805 [Deltaproteobacteria bacterium TL4]